MAKQEKSEQGANEPVLKPGFVWVHNPKTGVQRQVRPGNDRHSKALEKHGYKKGPLSKSAASKAPVEAETI